MESFSKPLQKVARCILKWTGACPPYSDCILGIFAILKVGRWPALTGHLAALKVVIVETDTND